METPTKTVGGEKNVNKLLKQFFFNFIIKDRSLIYIDGLFLDLKVLGRNYSSSSIQYVSELQQQGESLSTENHH